MKITKRQLKRIIREAMDPRVLEEPSGGYIGDALTHDPDYPEPPDPTGTELEPEFFRDMQTAEDAAVNMVFGDGSERLGDTLPWEVRIVSVDGEYSLYAMKDGFDRYNGEGKEVAALSRGGAIRYGRRIGGR